MKSSTKSYTYSIEYNGVYCRFYPIIVKLYPHTIDEHLPYSELPEYVYGKVQIGYTGFYPLYHYTTIHKSKIKVNTDKNDKKYKNKKEW